MPPPTHAMPPSPTLPSQSSQIPTPPHSHHHHLNAAAPSASSPPIDDPLASGIRTLLDPHISTTTDKLWEVHSYQLELQRELEKLIQDLKTFLSQTEPPPIRPLVVKISTVGKRLNAVQNSLQTIQARVNRIYVTLNKQRTGST